MIHIITVHHKNDKWLDIQYEYIKKYTNEDFKIYLWADSINVSNPSRYHLIKKGTSRPKGKKQSQHSARLNVLAKCVIEASETNPTDLLLFLDGDSFPIGEYIPKIQKLLETNALVGIIRPENKSNLIPQGDHYPHPSFSIISVENWIKIEGDWGYLPSRDHYDIGGMLPGKIDEAGLKWHGLRKSQNLLDDFEHPVFFSVYEDVIYHHGAGFRRPISRGDKAKPQKDKQIVQENKIFSQQAYQKIKNKMSE